jgi:hypothetical protein
MRIEQVPHELDRQTNIAEQKVREVAKQDEATLLSFTTEKVAPVKDDAAELREKGRSKHEEVQSLTASLRDDLERKNKAVLEELIRKEAFF